MLSNQIINFQKHVLAGLKKLIVITCLICFMWLMAASTAPVCAASQKVPVEIPSFKVTINGQTIDNAYSQYPFITYKGITYFPMTYTDCRYLGLETKWSSEAGLSVEKTGVFGEFGRTLLTLKNGTKYQADIANFKIRINKQAIDNGKEEYPLITFRNVTYFPLTWHYAVDAFGWDYQFDNATGLIINSKQLSVEKQTLSHYSKSTHSATLMDGFIYYQGIDGDVGGIYRASFENPGTATLIHALPVENSKTPLVSFFKKSNSTYFSYNIGNAITGTTHYYRINSQGKTQELFSGNVDFIPLNATTIMVDFKTPPQNGNLYVYDSNNQKKQLGRTDLLYGWIQYADGGLHGSSGISLLNEWIYTTASDPKAAIPKTAIFKVNTQTNETIAISDIPVQDYALKGTNLYIVNSDTSKLYLKDLKNGAETILTENAVDDFDTIGNIVYYIAKESRNLFRRDSQGNETLLLPNQSADFVQTNGNYCIVLLSEDADYGMIILNTKGEVLFKTSDAVANVSIEGNALLYNTEKNGNAYIVALP